MAAEIFVYNSKRKSRDTVVFENRDIQNKKQ